MASRAALGLVEYQLTQRFLEKCYVLCNQQRWRRL
jgi:hypothetical protein